MNMKRALLLASAVLAVGARAAVVEFNNVNVSIPDGDEGGIFVGGTVSGLGAVTISDVNVRLTFETDPLGTTPMFNGDLYVGLSFGTGYSVLLSRVGRTVDADSGAGSSGYGDAGFGDPCGCQVFRLDDQASWDVHTYQSHTFTVPLTGDWQPSARQDNSVLPGHEVTSTPRVTSGPELATLAAFNGLNPNGAWSLYIIDMAGGGEARLQSWALEFTTVPEPGEWAAVAGVGLAGFALWRRRREA